MCMCTFLLLFLICVKQCLLQCDHRCWCKGCCPFLPFVKKQTKYFNQGMRGLSTVCARLGNCVYRWNTHSWCFSVCLFVFYGTSFFSLLSYLSVLIVSPFSFFVSVVYIRDAIGHSLIRGKKLLPLSLASCTMSILDGATGVVSNVNKERQHDNSQAAHLEAFLEERLRQWEIEEAYIIHTWGRVGGMSSAMYRSQLRKAEGILDRTRKQKEECRLQVGLQAQKRRELKSRDRLAAESRSRTLAKSMAAIRAMERQRAKAWERLSPRVNSRPTPAHLLHIGSPIATRMKETLVTKPSQERHGGPVVPPAARRPTAVSSLSPPLVQAHETLASVTAAELNGADDSAAHKIVPGAIRPFMRKDPNNKAEGKSSLNVFLVAHNSTGQNTVISPTDARQSESWSSTSSLIIDPAVEATRVKKTPHSGSPVLPRDHVPPLSEIIMRRKQSADVVLSNSASLLTSRQLFSTPTTPQLSQPLPPSSEPSRLSHRPTFARGMSLEPMTCTLSASLADVIVSSSAEESLCPPHKRDVTAIYQSDGRYSDQPPLAQSSARAHVGWLRGGAMPAAIALSLHQSGEETFAGLDLTMSPIIGESKLGDVSSMSSADSYLQVLL